MIVTIDAKALKDLAKINKKIASTIFSKIERLENFPYVTNVKKLVRFYPPFRLRVGSYRILFAVKDDIVTIYRIRHRKESYR